MLCRRKDSKNPEFQLMYMCKALRRAALVSLPGLKALARVFMLTCLRSTLSTRQQVRYMHIKHAAYLGNILKRIVTANEN